MHRKSVFGVIVSKILGLILFVLTLWLANYLIPIVNSPVYAEVVLFFNRNFAFFVGMSIIFAVGDIFFALPFPINLPGPIVYAVASMFLLAFLGRIFGLVDALSGVNIISPFRAISFIIYPLVFFAVIAGCYISLFFRLIPKPEIHMKKTKTTNSKTKTWDEVGDEFRNTLYDFFGMMRRKFNGK